MSSRFQKWGAVLSLVGLVGCAGGRAVVPVSELTEPSGEEAWYVITTGGDELEFISLKSDGRALNGTVRTVQQRLVGQGDDERLESRNQYREMSLPLSDVARVEVRRGGTSPFALLGAAAVLIGGSFLLLGGDDPPAGGTGGDGREPPPLP
jgi:hypothetical protein